MYCPNCGEADQKKKTYCRKCGVYLADFGKISKLQRPVNENFNANTVLSALTGTVSLVLAITLYVMFLGKEGTPVIIYIVAGFLTAMFAWQLQSFLRILQLRKQFKRQSEIIADDEEVQNELDTSPIKESLPEANMEDVVPISVTENTTKNLTEKVKRSTKS